VPGAVKVCGQRGWVTFCSNCKDWEPFEVGPKQTVMISGGEQSVLVRHGAWCKTCDLNLPEVVRYGEGKKAEAAP
jgi:hypothetical protein